MEFKFDREVFDLWDNALQAHQNKQYVWGLPGRSTGVNTYQIEAPEAGKVYIRVLDDAGTSTSVTTAINLGANLDPKVRVRCQYIEGELTIINPSPKDAIKSYGRNASQTAVPPHSGAIGAGLEDYVETQRLLAGLVHASPEGGWYVRIEGFRFKNQHEPTVDYLINSANVPVTVGETRLVGIAWDYVTSSFVQVVGTASTKSVNAYNDSDIDALAFGSSEVPLGAVTLYESQTSINDGIARILDARYFFDIAGDVALDAGELDYTPTTDADWVDPNPASVQEALDDLAAEVTGLIGSISTVVFSDDDVSNPPTDAELDTAFGTPATVGAGFVGLIDDAGADANVYIALSNGISWWYTALTKAV